MPYVGISVLPSDVQPIALALSICSLILFSGKIRFDLISVLLLAILAMAITSFVMSIYDIGGNMMFDARALFGYLTAPIVYLYFRNYLFSEGPTAVARFVDIAVIVTFFGFLLNIIGLTSVIQIFVNRAIFDDSTVGARGLTSFFSEQSRIPTQALFFAFFYMIAGCLNWPRAISLLSMSALSASGQFFINIVVFISSMGAAVFYNSIRNGQFRGIHLAYTMAGFLFLTGIYLTARDHYLYLIEIGLPRRGIEAFHEIAVFNIGSLSDDLGFLYKVSGPLQGISAIWFEPFKIRIGTAYYFEFERDLFAIYVNLIYHIFESTLVPLPPRSYSIFGAWWSDFRIYGMFATLVFVVALGKRSLAAKTSVLVGIYAVLIFLFLFRSNTSDPTPWAAVAALTYAGRRWLHKDEEA